MRGGAAASGRLPHLRRRVQGSPAAPLASEPRAAAGPPFSFPARHLPARAPSGSHPDNASFPGRFRPPRGRASHSPRRPEPARGSAQLHPARRASCRAPSAGTGLGRPQGANPHGAHSLRRRAWSRAGPTPRAPRAQRRHVALRRELALSTERRSPTPAQPAGALWTSARPDAAAGRPGVASACAPSALRPGRPRGLFLRPPAQPSPRAATGTARCTPCATGGQSGLSGRGSRGGSCLGWTHADAAQRYHRRAPALARGIAWPSAGGRGPPTAHAASTRGAGTSRAGPRRPAAPAACGTFALGVGADAAAVQAGGGGPRPRCTCRAAADCSRESPGQRPRGPASVRTGDTDARQKRPAASDSASGGGKASATGCPSCPGPGSFPRANARCHGQCHRFAHGHPVARAASVQRHLRR
jgi:hypothetical protein